MEFIQTNNHALLQGLQRRATLQPEQKSLLMIGCPSEHVMDQLVLQTEDSWMSPHLLQGLELWQTNDLNDWRERVWNYYTPPDHDGPSMGDYTEDDDFVFLLLQRVYLHLGGTQTFTKLKESITTQAKQPTLLRHGSKTIDNGLVRRQQQEVLQTAKMAINDLQLQQEQVWLDNQMPMLDFGTKANDILKTARDRLTRQGGDEHMSVLHSILGELNALYQVQVQSLRDYYGRRYEHVLETQPSDDWQPAAARSTQAFEAAAKHAIPALYATFLQQDSSLSSQHLFSHVEALQGLVSDLLQATQLYQDPLLDEDEDDSEASAAATASRRVARWYEKLAARAFVLSVNYLQGWLAWQGIQRAAVQRDRDMPKFPLF